MLFSFSQVVAIIDLVCEDKQAWDLSTLLEVPMMEVDPIEDTTTHLFAASIRPFYHVVNQALFDIMDYFSFSRVAVVYDGAFDGSFFFIWNLSSLALAKLSNEDVFNVPTLLDPTMFYHLAANGWCSSNIFLI